ncbi:hypothetical protein DRP04_01745 [Archaeoglobales archaeon]|nr:MAG: hypothetical protein DRP04_01745 [Archaeoglobales archaeon]
MLVEEVFSSLRDLIRSRRLAREELFRRTLIPTPEEVGEMLAKPAMIITGMLDRDVKKIIKQLKGGNPHPISFEEAVEAVAQTEWARHWAQSICKMAGHIPGTPEYNTCVEKLARKAAEGLLE